MRDKIICKMGQYDIPVVQLQPIFNVDLLRSNIAIFGSAMSGKTTCLKQLINQLHTQMSKSEEQIFILDFSGALRVYKDMPLVAAYFDNSNEEYVKRIFKILENVLKDNVKKLGSDNYSSADIQPIHTTFIIDNLNSFVDENRYATYQDKFGRICREGRTRGITVVFTASDTKGVSRYMLAFEQKISLNFPADKNVEIFGEKAEPIGNIAGRGYANVTERPDGILGTFSMNSPYEFQAYMAKNLLHNNQFVQKFGYSGDTDAVEHYRNHVKRYMTFPDELRREDFEKLKQPYEAGEKAPGPDAIEIGLDYVEFKPVTVDVDQSRVIGIYGKKEFGKTNLLSIILEKLIEQKPYANLVFFDDGRKELEQFYKKYRNRAVHCIDIDEYADVEIQLYGGPVIVKKLSPILQFYKYIHENIYCMGTGEDYGAYSDILKEIYGDKIDENYVFDEYNKPSDSETERGQWGILPGNSQPVIFVIQSKAIYTNSKTNSAFIHYLLQEMMDIAEEKDFVFLFTDIKKITEPEINSLFNGMLKTIFLLDNIAEFAAEKGSRTVFGEMDVKGLKEEYAKCEPGDGYVYDVEADKLKKMKFLFNPEL